MAVSQADLPRKARDQTEVSTSTPLIFGFFCSHNRCLVEDGQTAQLFHAAYDAEQTL